MKNYFGKGIKNLKFISKICNCSYNIVNNTVSLIKIGNIKFLNNKINRVPWTQKLFEKHLDSLKNICD